MGDPGSEPLPDICFRVQFGRYRSYADARVEPVAKLVDLAGAEWRILLVAEVVAGIRLAQFQWLVEDDGSAAVHLWLPLLLHEAQAVEHAGEFAAVEGHSVAGWCWSGTGRHVQLM